MILMRKAFVAGIKAFYNKVREQMVINHHNLVYYKYEFKASYNWGQFIYYLRLNQNAHLREMVVKTDWINDCR